MVATILSLIRHNTESKHIRMRAKVGKRTPSSKAAILRQLGNFKIDQSIQHKRRYILIRYYDSLIFHNVKRPQVREYDINFKLTMDIGI